MLIYTNRSTVSSPSKPLPYYKSKAMVCSQDSDAYSKRDKSCGDRIRRLFSSTPRGLLIEAG